MKKNLSRRSFMRYGSAACALLLGGTFLSGGGAARISAQTAAQNKVPDRGPRLDLETVNQFVIAGHFNLVKVKEMLAKEPKLINSAWDWGGGDWETALGGASHVGNREIAEFLIKNGARMDVFAAAMLDKIDFVKAAVKAFSENRSILGPHGITLYAHAEKGKAAKVLKYLDSLK